MIFFTKFQSQFITAYGVGRGNAPALITSAGHLWAVLYFLNRYVTLVERSQTCDPCARI